MTFPQNPEDTMRHVTLHCTACGRRKPYFPEQAGEDLPAEVDVIETTGCDLCDDGGGFVEETWRDANGKIVEPVQ
jgi:hypothetical protein